MVSESSCSSNVLTWFLRKRDSRHRPRVKEMYLELITGSRVETEVEMEGRKFHQRVYYWSGTTEIGITHHGQLPRLDDGGLPGRSDI